MNAYFVVEGSSTEKQVYPAWLKHALPHLKQVKKPEDITVDSFFLISGNGYPSILKHIEAAVLTINETHQICESRYTYLVIVVDSEEESVAARLAEISKVIETAESLEGVAVVPIVQHRCLETWLLGNKIAIPVNSTCELTCQHKRFYDVRQADPELMEKPKACQESTIAQYHYKYLKDALKSRSGRGIYSKKDASVVCEEGYLKQITSRIQQTGHIASFGALLNFIKTLQDTYAINMSNPPRQKHF